MPHGNSIRLEIVDAESEVGSARLPQMNDRIRALETEGSLV